MADNLYIGLKTRKIQDGYILYLKSNTQIINLKFGTKSLINIGLIESE